MRYTLPPLNALKAFEATGRTGSLSAAARELRVSVGAVSRHVSILESYFGCGLFVRHHDGVQLTQWGRSLHDRISNAFELMDSACRDVDTGHSRPIRLRTYATFATEWLAPRLVHFREQHPAIGVQVKQAFSDISFISEPIDAAVTAAPLVESHIEQVSLFETLFAIVAAPSIIPDCSIDCLASSGAPPVLFARREVPFWEALYDKLGLPPPQFDRGLEFDNLSLTYQAARRGAGVALGLLFFIADDLAAGSLVPVSRTCINAGLTHSLMFRSRGQKHPGIASLKAWMLEEAQGTNSTLEKMMGDLFDAPSNLEIAPSVIA